MDGKDVLTEAGESASGEGAVDLSALGQQVTLPEPEKTVEVDLGFEKGEKDDPDIDVGDKEKKDDEPDKAHGDEPDGGDTGKGDDSKDGDDTKGPKDGGGEDGQGDNPDTGDEPDKSKDEGEVTAGDTDEQKLEDLKPDEIKVTLGEDEEVTVAELMDEVEELREFKAEIDGDEFFSKLHKYYKETGDLTPYLESQTVDYEKKSDLELMRQASFKENAGMDQRFQEKLFKNEMLDKYGYDLDAGEFITDEDDPKVDPELSEAKLKRDAGRARAERIKAQEDFKIPEKQERPDPLAESRKAEAKRVDNWIKTVDADPSTKSLLETGKLKIGTKSGEFGYEPKDTKGIVEMTKDQAKFFELFNDNGKVNTGLFQKMAAYAQDPSGFEESLITHGKTLATEESLKEKKNTGDRVKNRQGVATNESGDEKTNLLNAFLKQKNS